MTEDEKEVLEGVQYYAVAINTDVVKRFDLILKSGTRHSVPYSLLPIYTLKAGNELEIAAYGLSITIKGRNLMPIYKSLSDENLLWMKESPSGKDDHETDCYISEIKISAEAFGQ